MRQASMPRTGGDLGDRGGGVQIGIGIPGLARIRLSLGIASSTVRLAGVSIRLGGCTKLPYFMDTATAIVRITATSAPTTAIGDRVLITSKGPTTRMEFIGDQAQLAAVFVLDRQPAVVSHELAAVTLMVEASMVEASMTEAFTEEWASTAAADSVVVDRSPILGINLLIIRSFK